MSEPVLKRMPLVVAERHAQRIVEAISGACERIQIAGSIRRRKEEVGDIEIVAIPKRGGTDLFGEPSDDSMLDPVLEKCCDDILTPIKGGDKYKQFWAIDPQERKG